MSLLQKDDVTLQSCDCEYLAGGRGYADMVGDLQPGDADDFAGSVCDDVHSTFVQVLELDVGEVVGHLFAAVQPKRREAVARGYRSDLNRHLNLVCINV